MPTMGRRPSKNFNLPPRLRARVRKYGTYYYYDTGETPRREIPLGSNYTEAVKKWAELEGDGHDVAAKIITLKVVFDEYLRKIIPTKAAKTQTENIRQLATLLEFFGEDTRLDDIEPLHVRQFLTYRKASPAGANREKALLSHIINMAREWGLTSMANPCAGVKGYTETGRNIYIEDEVFSAVYNAACQPIRDAMDLAYLTGQRVSDTLKMSEADIKDGVIHVNQGKTEKRLRINITGELKTLIDRIIAKKEGFKIRTLQLVCTETGMPLRLRAMQDRFNRARDLAAKSNKKLKAEIEAFQFRDLRAKAGTDKLESSGNIVIAQRQLGHTTIGMTEHYIRDRKGDFVEPTK